MPIVLKDQPNERESGPFQIFHTNIGNLVLLSQGLSKRDDVVEQLRKAGLDFTTAAKSLNIDPSDPRTIKQTVVDSVTEAAKTAVRISSETVDYIKTQRFAKKWTLVMLVTFTEVYLEEILQLLVARGFEGSSFPREIAKEMESRWIQGVLRQGKPKDWIKKLERFGATGYPSDLAEEMEKIWKRRHAIVHTSDLALGHALQELLDAIKVISSFTETTDRFVVAITQP